MLNKGTKRRYHSVFTLYARYVYLIIKCNITFRLITALLHGQSLARASVRVTNHIAICRLKISYAPSRLIKREKTQGKGYPCVGPKINYSKISVCFVKMSVVFFTKHVTRRYRLNSRKYRISSRCHSNICNGPSLLLCLDRNNTIVEFYFVCNKIA